MLGNPIVQTHLEIQLNLLTSLGNHRPLNVLRPILFSISEHTGDMGELVIQSLRNYGRHEKRHIHHHVIAI